MSGEGREGPGAAGVTRGFRIRVRTLIVLVACCGAVFWAVTVIRDSVPVNGSAKALRSGRTPERLAAARQLGSIVPGEAAVAIPALIAALGDEDEEVGITVVQSLGAAGSTAFTVPSGRPLTRVAAEALAEALRDKRDGVRAQAARALGVLGATTSVAPPPALIAALREDRSSDVRAEVAAALGSFHAGFEEVIPPLFAALEDENLKVRAAAHSALARRDSRPSPSAVPFLIKVLREHRNPRVRFLAATVLIRVGPQARDAIPTLIATLKEPLIPRPADLVPPPAPTVRSPAPVSQPPYTWDLACESARALGAIARDEESADEVVVAGLTDLLRSEHAWRRGAAAEALFMIGKDTSATAPTLVLALTEAVDSKTDFDNNSWFARALGLVAPGSGATGQTVSALTNALNSKNEGTRAYSADALGRFGPAASAAVPRLRTLERDPSRFVSSMAASALKKIEVAAGPAGTPAR